MAKVKPYEWTKHRVRLLCYALDPKMPDGARAVVMRQLGAKKLGQGCYRVAYRLGDFVIKQVDETQGVDIHEDVFRFAELLGIQIAHTEVHHGWMLQRWFKPITWGDYTRSVEKLVEDTDYWSANVDFNHCNVGRDRRGRLTAFDW